MYLGETTEKVSEIGLRNSSARLLPAGTVVLSRTASVGFSGIMPRPMATTQDFANWIPGPLLDSKFLLHVFRAMAPEFERLRMGSTHKTIYMPDVKGFRIPLPPLGSQRAIADFLDRKTAAIDALIAKKERLVEVLQEKRQALITQAVTKGLDPNVPMKDSGVEWLGEIPAHWEVKALKHSGAMVTSGSRAWASYYSDTGALFLQSGNLDRMLGVDTSDAQRIIPPESAEGRRTAVRLNDVLVCITGALTGNVGMVFNAIGEAYVNQHLALIRPDPTRIDPAFLALSLTSRIGGTQFDMAQYGGTKQGLGLDDVKNVLIPTPPLGEQRVLSSAVLSRVSISRSAERRIKTQQQLLREYRQALITAAVTGQLDVLAKEAAA